MIIQNGLDFNITIA